MHDVEGLERRQVADEAFGLLAVEPGAVHPGVEVDAGSQRSIFGTGSSREQAATALKYRGVPLVIAASFSETYKRNAFNNGFPVIDCPELVDHLAASARLRAGRSLRRSR